MREGSPVSRGWKRLVVATALAAAVLGGPELAASAGPGLGLVAVVPLAGANPRAVAVDPGLNRIYVAENVGGYLSVVDGATNTVTATVALAGGGVEGMAVDPATHRIYVALWYSGAVDVIDGTTLTRVGTTFVGGLLRGLALDPSRDRLYAASQSGTLHVRKMSTLAPVGSVGVGAYATSVAVDPALDRVYVTNALGGTVSIVDGSTLTATTVGLGSLPMSVAANSITSKTYVGLEASGTVKVIDGATGAILSTIPSGGATLYGATVDEGRNMVYLTNGDGKTLAAVDGSADAVVATVTLGPGLLGVGVNPITNRVYAAGRTASGGGALFVVDGIAPAPVVSLPAPITAECQGPPGTSISFSATVEGTPPAGSVLVVEDVTGGRTLLSVPAAEGTFPVTAVFPLGTSAVEARVVAGSSVLATASTSVRIVDTTAPSLQVSGLPAEIWPPDHRMVRILPAVTATDACDAAPAVTLVVTSSEADDGLGDGDTAGDVVVHSSTDIELRAERSGAGSGRTYTFVWTCTDGSGNAAVATATVAVPKSQGKVK